MLMNSDMFNFRRAKSRIKELEDKLEKFQSNSPTRENLNMANRVLQEMDELLEKKELFWRQRSRAILRPREVMVCQLCSSEYSGV